VVGINVGKILRGSYPAEIPVEQPTKFDLAVNLKTGLDVPGPHRRGDRIMIGVGTLF
jgi:putative ABC transport system substrate-binding protein